MPGGTKREREDIISYTFLGEHRVVDSGRAALRELCDTLALRHAEKVDTLPAVIVYRDKRWFASSPDGMHFPYRVLGTNIWLDVNLKTRDIKKIATDVVRHFGYGVETLRVETRVRPVEH